MRGEKDGYCLVLGGGGARGVYHLGVWRALREIGVRIDAVIGNSVGALVAGFIAQKDMASLEEIISNIGLGDIIAIPDELERDGEFVLDRKNFKTLLEYRKKIFKKRGLDTLPMSKTLKKYLDESRIRNGGIDLGVITYHLNELKPVEIFIDQMKEGALLDYLKASATLPGFTVTKISDKQFIDGGVYNNIPYDMARKRGYRNIIMVDISGIGITRRPDFKNTRTVYIKNSVTMGGVLDFDKEFLTRFTQLGYLDTMRVFGRYRGFRYFIEENKSVYKRIARVAESDEYLSYIGETAQRLKLNQADLPESAIRALLPEEIEHDRFWIYSLLDCSAWILGLDRVRSYPLKELTDLLHAEQERAEKSIGSLRESLSPGKLKKLLVEIKTVRDKRDLGTLAHRSLYYYERILGELLKRVQNKIPFASFDTFFPGVHAGFAGLELVRLFREHRRGIRPLLGFIPKKPSG
ncbi:MAG: patatin-like phospholipase family protein [Spirochaetota bacterium]